MFRCYRNDPDFGGRGLEPEKWYPLVGPMLQAFGSAPVVRQAHHEGLRDWGAQSISSSGGPHLSEDLMVSLSNHEGRVQRVMQTPGRRSN